MKSIADGLSSLKKKPMADKIHDEILEMIIKKGSKEEVILTEGRMMELFGVSKAPVREALIRLCSENVLTSIPRFGYVVVQMEEKDAREVAGIRVLLETEALRTGFEEIVENHLEDIRMQIETREVEGKVDVWRILEDNEAFHLQLASYAGNQTLNRFLRESLQLQKRIYAQIQWDKESSLEADNNEVPHKKIYEALREKDLEKSIRALKEDILA